MNPHQRSVPTGSRADKEDGMYTLQRYLFYERASAVTCGQMEGPLGLRQNELHQKEEDTSEELVSVWMPGRSEGTTATKEPGLAVKELGKTWTPWPVVPHLREAQTPARGSSDRQEVSYRGHAGSGQSCTGHGTPHPTQLNCHPSGPLLLREPQESG